MSEEKLVPKLRFSGFTDEWNEVTLNDVATFSKGKGISKNDISNYGIECVRYGELYTKYNEMIYNIESKTDLNKNELKLSEKNDILMPCSGETAIDLATASCIQKDQVAIGGDITVIKTNQYAPFITYYLNQKKTEIAKYAQGVSIVHLYPKDFKVMNIRIPSINEQKMIIGLLEEITKKEQLLESKYQQYQEYKKYLMQQIFTQKLRFKNDKQWNVYLLRNFINEYNERMGNKSNLPILSSTLNGIFLQNEYFNKSVSSKDVKNYKIVPNGYFTYRSMSDTGKFRFNIQSIVEVGIISPAYPVFSTQNIDDYFLYYYLNNSNFIKKQILSLKEGGTRYALSFSKFKKLKISLPSLEEQEKIANFLSAVDKKIDLIQTQIQKMEEFKKGLLQQMFVVQLILSLLQNKKHI